MRTATIQKDANSSVNENKNSSFSTFKAEKDVSAQERKSLKLDSKLKNTIDSGERPKYNFQGVVNFQNISILPPSYIPLQPKIKINSPNDKYEQEADRVAEQVVRMPAQTIQRKCSKCGKEEEIQRAPIRGIQRKCANCEEEEMIQTKSNGNSQGVASNDLMTQIGNTRGGGQAMDSNTRSFMEPRFGIDLGQVRIHNSGQAAGMNQEINARAFTLGNDIYFNRGEYSPGSVEGKKLLAHELTHTIQQSSRPALNHTKARGTIMREEKSGEPEKKDEKVVKPSPKIHDFDNKPSSCACLVHIHNDERNSKAVAHALRDKCNYSLIDVSDSKSSGRNLKTSLKVITKLKDKKSGKMTNMRDDPNEIFDPEVLKLCGDRSKAPAGVSVDEVCNFYDDLKTCSNDFSKPVVALHNNTKLKPRDATEKKKDYRKRARKESTNIIRWAESEAISKTIEGDSKNPDSVIWTSNPEDFKTLAGKGNLNTGLQDPDFKKDNDLSTLFNHIPDLAALENETILQAAAAMLTMSVRSLTMDQALFILTELFKFQKKRQIRYINIETEHAKNKFNKGLADDNLDFVHEVLSALGLWCCDDDVTVSSLKTDLKNPGKKEKAE